MRIARYVKRGDAQASAQIGLGVEEADLSPADRSADGDAPDSTLLHSPDDPFALVHRMVARPPTAPEEAIPLADVQLPRPPGSSGGLGGRGDLRAEQAGEARKSRSKGGRSTTWSTRADRPELFFKATPSRVVGPDQAIRVRQDTKLVRPRARAGAGPLAPAMEIVGYTDGQRRQRPRHRGRQSRSICPRPRFTTPAAPSDRSITLARSMPPLRSRSRSAWRSTGAGPDRPQGFDLGWLADGPEARRPGRLARPRQPVPRRGLPPDRDRNRPARRLLARTRRPRPDHASDGIGTLTNPVVRGPIR